MPGLKKGKLRLRPGSPAQPLPTPSPSFLGWLRRPSRSRSKRGLKQGLGSTSEAAGAPRTPEPEKRRVLRAPSGEGCGEGARAGVSGLCASGAAAHGLRQSSAQGLLHGRAPPRPVHAEAALDVPTGGAPPNWDDSDYRPDGYDGPKETDYSPSRETGESRLMRNLQSTAGRQQKETEKSRTGSLSHSERETGGSCPAPSGPQARAGHWRQE